MTKLAPRVQLTLLPIQSDVACLPACLISVYSLVIQSPRIVRKAIEKKSERTFEWGPLNAA